MIMLRPVLAVMLLAAALIIASHYIPADPCMVAGRYYGVRVC